MLDLENRLDEVLDRCKDTVRAVVEFVTQQVERHIGVDTVQPTFKDKNNITREIDGKAHGLYQFKLNDDFGTAVTIAGEEEAKEIDWSKEERFLASVDAVDGTDLIVRGFYNWCSALFLFKPNSHVIASWVGMPSSRVGKTALGASKEVPTGTVYFAKSGEAFKEEDSEGKPKRSKVLVPAENRQKKLEDASICFYGQKAKNFLSVFNQKRLVSKLKEFKSKADGGGFVPFRIYNLAGNPMLVKVGEGIVDVVIELEGQRVYDVIPGAYFAQQAGAFWGDLKGLEINNQYLLSNGFLSDPKKKLTYIVASSKALYDEVLATIVPPKGPRKRQPH